MLILGLLAAAALLLVAGSVLLARRFSFPESYEPRPASLEGLPPEDADRFEAWGRALEAKGFRRVGDFRVDLSLGRGVAQVEQKRVWLSEDRTTWAAAKRFSVLNPAMDGVARAWRLLGFTSRLPSGGVVSTHTCRAADNSFLRDPESSSRVWPGLEDVDLLHEAHARHLRERGAAPEATDGDLAAFERATWKRYTTLSTAQGYLTRIDGRLRSTLKLALLSSLRGLNPFLLERGGAGTVGAKLAGLAGAAALGAWALGGAWPLAALFAGAAAAACALFPQSHIVSWTLASLPAHAILTARGEPAGWGWIAGFLTFAFVMPPLESWRFRRAAAALQHPDAGPPPLSRGARLAWTAAVLGCLLASAGLLVWMRAPKTIDPFAQLAAALGMLALAGLLLASVVAGLAAKRRTELKRTLDGLGLCALIVLAGFLGGYGLASRDGEASRAAAEEVAARLDAYRAAKGAYPPSLADLGAIPAPRCGWRPAAFTYAARPDGYTLSWPSATGPRTRP